jgi:phosphoenolpyruvate carboxykinase (ATP)
MSIYWNLPVAELYRDSLLNNKYTISSTGALVAYSGDYTGRSPKDKRIVYDENSKDIWWGKINMKINKKLFNFYYKSSLDYLSDILLKDKDVYIIDAYAGWDENHRIKVRILCTDPYHALFMRNMLIPSDTEFEEPDFTIINVGELKLSDVEDKDMNVKKDNTLKDNLVAIDLTQMKMVIYGTRYAGEMKKGVLTIMMYLMQNKNMLTLHSSANIDNNGNTSLFFGLSGTGKTTLSAEENRLLIGDDEHVWTDKGIFNIEGGCYAKCIGLKQENEPEIFHAIKYGSVLENVIMNDDNVVDFNDISITHNTRCAYPLNHISNAIFPSVGNHPNNIILLTCDAFGVLPPISKLTSKKAVFFFISGYTSKMPGTEVGVEKPKMVFSTCFAAPFIIWQPEKYGMLLEEKLNKHNTNVWLVNTGWIEGEYGIGRRIPIKHTRKIIDSIHNNELNNVEYEKFPYFDIMIPKTCKDIPENILNPSKSWSDEKLYNIKLKELYDNFKTDFVENYGLDLFNKLN